MDEMKNQVQVDAIVQSEKKGVSLSIVVLLIIIFSVLFGIGGWFLGSKSTKSDENNNVMKEENSVSDKKPSDNEAPQNSGDYTFYSSEKIPLKFGNETIDMVVNYYVDEEVIEIDENTSTFGETDKDEVNAYVIRREFLLNNQPIGKIHFVGKFDVSMYDEKPKFDLAMKEYDFESFGFKDSKTDKYYNIFSFKDDKVLYLPSTDECIIGGAEYGAYEFNYTYIFDEQGKILKELNLSDECGRTPGISVSKEEAEGKYYSSDEADYVLYPDGRWIDAHDNYFYYLKYDDTNGEYTEHKFSVEDGVVNDQILKVYKYDSDNVLSAAGQTC